MNVVARFLVLVTLVLFAQISAQAWRAAGHMNCAVLAYRQSPPEVKKKLFLILGNHPNYSLWQQDFQSIQSALPRDLDFGMYLMMRASVWPDEIRRSGSQFDHPEWHFVDYPLIPPSFPMEPRLSPEKDALFAISLSEKKLLDKQASPRERAVYLSWLIHLIGEIHQPLHCSTLVTALYPLPKGDLNGGTFYVKLGQRALRLHTFWDDLGGTSIDPRHIFSGAVKLEKERPRWTLLETNKVSTPEMWSLESRLVAISEVYEDGRLEGNPDPDMARPLSTAYRLEARNVAAERISIAGYRLSDTLTRILAPAD